MTRSIIIAAVASLLVAALAVVAVADEHATGIDRKANVFAGSVAVLTILRKPFRPVFAGTGQAAKSRCRAGAQRERQGQECDNACQRVQFGGTMFSSHSDHFDIFSSNTNSVI